MSKPYVIGTASGLASASREIPNALIAVLVVTTLGATPVSLGLIEAGAAAAAGVGRSMAARRFGRRRALGGPVSLATTAFLSALLGLVTAPWQAGLLRSSVSGLDDLRDPTEDTGVGPDIGQRDVAGKRLAHRGTQIGRVVGPVFALFLFAEFGVRVAMCLAVIPGLLALVIVLRVGRATPAVGDVAGRTDPASAGVTVSWREVLRGPTRRIAIAVTAFEFGNVAIALLLLRSIILLSAQRDKTEAVIISLAMYALYNLAGVLVTAPAQRRSTSGGAASALLFGVILFLVAYFGFALNGGNIVILAAAFIGAGLGLGAIRAAERGIIADHFAADARRSATDLLSKAQLFGRMTATAITGFLWSVVSIQSAVAYLSVWLSLSIVGAVAALRGSGTRSTPRVRS